MIPSDVGLRSYFQRMELCKRPLPTETKALIDELGLRVLTILPFHLLLEIRSADGALQVTLDEANATSFRVFENDTLIFEFGVTGEPRKAWSRVLEGKDDTVIKALKMVMCKAFNGKRGLHLYHPPYPEPEIMLVTEVEGSPAPRRFINEAWMNWMKDSNRFNHLTRVVALRLIMNKLFPGGHDGKVARMVPPLKEESLEFEILEVKRI